MGKASEGREGGWIEPYRGAEGGDGLFVPAELLPPILGFLKRWAQSGTAIVIVEQHVRLSLSVATRIMTLERGQIVRTSEPGEFAATLAERRVHTPTIPLR